MKKIISSLFLLFTASSVVASTGDNCSCKVNSHTYFAVRPQFQIGSPEYESLAHSLRTARECGRKIGFQAVVFGGKSADKRDLGTFFAPFCSNEIPIDGTIAINSKNILPQNFNIFSVQFSNFVADQLNLEGNLTNPFRSVITLRPQQSVIGFGFSWQQEIFLGEHWFWYGVSAPLLHVRNTMGLKELIGTGTEFYTVQPLAGEETNLNKNLRSMKEALVQDCWQFGKIDNKIHKTTRLGFVQVQIGMKWASNECYYFEPFVGATFPTGNKPDARLVFEPIAGNGGHYGALWGGNGGYVLWVNCDEDLRLSLETNLVMQYLFGTTQKRSIDLKYKPWSRYIETYANEAQANQALALGLGNQTQLRQGIFLSTPGINLLTQNVTVKPGFNLTHNMAITLKQNRCDKGFDFEGGYNFFARQPECVSLKKTF